MNKRKILLAATLLIFISTITFGQDTWDLQRCVEYAWANNISVKQSDVQARIAKVDLEQSKWAQYPSANFSTNTGLQFGRSIDPTTNQFTSNQLLYQGFNVNAGVTIFNWNRLKNNVISSQYASKAAEADVEKARNDIALNVATFYLTVLLARQQVDVARIQMEQTRSQMVATRRKVDAGALPEVDALTFEGQYASDSANYLSAQATADQNLLDLKGLLNIDASLPFDIETPPVAQIPIDPILSLQPDIVYDIALKNQPAQKANELRLRSFEASVKASKANFYPTISFGGSLGTNFASSNRQITGVDFLGYESPSALSPVVDVGGTNYPVVSPIIVPVQGKKTFGQLWKGWGTQLDNNFRQNIGLTISVPILNGGAAKFNYERSKLMLKNVQVTKEQIDQTLKNDIYKAYYSAMAAVQKFNATKATVAATQKTYDFALKRYDLGLLSTFDLITSQNNLTRAKLDLATSEFDYVFKMKVLEFYKGQGIRLQ